MNIAAVSNKPSTMVYEMLPREYCGGKNLM